MFRVLYGALGGDLAEHETYLEALDASCVNDCKSLADALLAPGAVRVRRLRTNVSELSSA